MKDNGFKLAKEKSRRYAAQTVTDVDYTDDIALLANTPAQAETLLHSLEQAAAGIGLQFFRKKINWNECKSNNNWKVVLTITQMI